MHAEREAIDRQIVAQTAYRTVADRFNVSKTALIRHKEHLPAQIVKAAEADDVRRAIDVVGQLRAINEASRAILADARKAGDPDTALKAIDRILRQIELQAKLIGELDESPRLNVLVTTDEWLTLRSRILLALEPYAEARRAVAAALGAGS
ncbi:MAG: hypothetical protein HY331_03160 [Chloroflexi bacterium]|nr:hypothetical protein [Chloroflexota bacterium]